MESLDNRLLTHVLSFLDDQDKSRLALVNTRCHELWRRDCRKRRKNLRFVGTLGDWTDGEEDDDDDYDDNDYDNDSDDEEEEECDQEELKTLLYGLHDILEEEPELEFLTSIKVVNTMEDHDHHEKSRTDTATTTASSSNDNDNMDDIDIGIETDDMDDYGFGEHVYESDDDDSVQIQDDLCGYHFDIHRADHGTSLEDCIKPSVIRTINRHGHRLCSTIPWNELIEELKIGVMAVIIARTVMQEV